MIEVIAVCSLSVNGLLNPSIILSCTAVIIVFLILSIVSDCDPSFSIILSNCVGSLKSLITFCTNPSGLIPGILLKAV